MRVISVPGRHVRHPQTGLPITDAGANVDENDLTIARYLADGDLQIEPTEQPAAADDAFVAPANTKSASAAASE
jgi:hypothetical protein